MDMFKMIQRMTDIENEEKTKQLNESAIAECGEAAMPAPMDQGNPVTMSVTLNASGKEHVDDLMAMMKAAGLDNAKPMAPDMMPMRQDMDRLGAIMRNAEMEEEGLEEYGNEPDEQYMSQPKGGGINKEKSMYPDADEGDNAMAVKEAGIDPDALRGLEKVNDINTLKKVAADMVKKSQIKQNKKMGLLRNIEQSRRPDNIIGLLWNAVLGKEGLHAMGSSWGKRFEDSEDEMRESIKSKLLKSLEEKKAKPDFLDMDKDGDKKEPMKKAIKDKGSKPKKGKVPPQFQKKK